MTDLEIVKEMSGIQEKMQNELAIERKRRVVAEEEWYKCRKGLIDSLGLFLKGAKLNDIYLCIGEILKTVKPDPWTEKDLDFGTDPYGDED